MSDANRIGREETPDEALPVGHRILQQLSPTFSGTLADAEIHRRKNKMCMDGICQSVMDDETIREKIANPLMDIVHQQVLMVLYSLDANGQLSQYREMLPLYLSADWSQCEAILEVIEKAGLLVRTDQGLRLTHPLPIDTAAAACGCHA